MKFLSLLVAAPLLIGAAPAVSLKPVGGWQLEYADNSCRLGRQFGEPDHLSTLVLEEAAPDASMTMVVISDSLPSRPDETDIKARFVGRENLLFEGGMGARSASRTQPAAMWAHVGFYVPKDATTPKMTPGQLRRWRAQRETESKQPIDLAKRDQDRAAELQRAATTTAITIEPPRSRPVTLETGPMGKPVTMLQDCTRDLVKSWGLHPDVQDRIVRPVRSKEPGITWFSSADYPRAAWARGQESVVLARVLVDAAGKVTGCSSLSHFDAPEFQKTVCDVIRRRGAFVPAELADGTKVPSFDTVTIRFVMPRF